MIDSATFRADGRDHSPTVGAIFSSVAPLIFSLQPSLAAPEGGFLPLRNPHLLAELPDSTQKILGQALFYKRFRDAPREDDFRARFCEASKPFIMSAVLSQPYWDMLFARRRPLAILRPGSNNFLRDRPADESFCPHELWSVMMRLYLYYFVYDDSGSPELSRCGHCGLHVLDKIAIHAIACCGSGCSRVARHDRLATIVLR